MCFAVERQCPAYLPDVLHVGMPETSYEDSALFTCLLAANRAGVRDLNAMKRVFMYQKEKALISELPHEQQQPGSKQSGQA